MKELKHCAFNMDTDCVEAVFTDGSKNEINCTAVENEVADNLYEQSNWSGWSITPRWIT